MNPLTVIAYKLSQLKPRPLRILFANLVRPDLDERYVRRMFLPWNSWANIIGVVPFDDLDKAMAISFRDINPNRETPVLVLIDQDGQNLPCEVSRFIDSKGITVITSAYPEFGTLDNDFCREIAHHDFEIGGKNEWDGAATRYSHYILRLLSSTHSKDSFPIHVHESLLNIQKQTQVFPLEALDLGCGPISWLRWGALEGLLRVTGVDPLLDVYETLLARHGLDVLPHLLPSQRYSVRFEEFDHEAVSGKFHFVFTNNALDHTQEPLTVISQLAKVLSPQGLALIQVATNEGTRQNWDQLHKYDIYYEDNVINCRNQAGDVLTLISSETPLRLHEVILYTDESLVFSATRNPNLNEAGVIQSPVRSVTAQPPVQPVENVSKVTTVDALAQFYEVELGVKLHQVKSKAEKLQQELRTAKQKAKRSDNALKEAESRIQAMETSKFWKLRSQWVKLKKQLGLTE